MNAKFSRQQLFLRNTLRGNSLVQILIYANLILFTLMVLHGTISGLGMRAIFNPPAQLLVHWGAQFWPYTLNGEIWRCLSYAYTHGGIVHIGFNMMVLYQIGPMIESEVGWPRFFVIYSTTAIFATLAGYILHPQIVVVGASGALFGIFGFAVCYYHRLGGSIGIQRRNFLFQWIVIALIFGFVLGADNAAHVGGLLSGAVFGWLTPTSIRGQRNTDFIYQGLAWFFVGATSLSLALVLITLLIRF